ncbi:hypothetical protein SS50377_23894 [Spironucleus salmonicida]|uniref:Uncharacterized protein n=1 Tax=Spironucleus salmonicida TaxID=348837 RepID=V6LVN0_9EUKA|nr:hypothetical protein SS50377_23894 [Spironucleus salmonicida]|eukprot:EST48298.1 hypothetical protein SS50377_11497 [Spironucleus salmonicida]
MFILSDLDRKVQHQQKLINQQRAREIQEEQLNSPPPQDGQIRDGRMNDRDYNEFDRKRIQKFKDNLIMRIQQNWKSVSAFDKVEAEQLAQEDKDFSARYYASVQRAVEQEAERERQKKLRFQAPEIPQKEVRIVKPQPKFMPDPVEEAQSPPQLRQTVKFQPPTPTPPIPPPQFQQQLAPPQPPQQIVLHQPQNEMMLHNLTQLSQQINMIQLQQQQLLAAQSNPSHDVQFQILQELQMQRMSQMQANSPEVQALKTRVSELEGLLMRQAKSPQATQDELADSVRAEIASTAQQIQQLEATRSELRREVAALARAESEAGEREILSIESLQQRNQERWEMLRQLDERFGLE